MFCTQCGNKLETDHRFCSRCGMAVQTTPPYPLQPHTTSPPPSDQPEAPASSPPADWREATDYRTVLSHPEVKEMVKTAAAQNTGGMTGEEFLKKVQPLVDAAGGGGVPLGLIAELAQPMYARLGVKTGTERRQGYASPLGRTLAATLCALARRGMTVTSAEQAADGCILQVDMPSTLTAWKGRMTLTLATQTEGTMMTGAVTIPGQAYDWGHAKRVLDQLHQDIMGFRSLQT